MLTMIILTAVLANQSGTPDGRLISRDEVGVPMQLKSCGNGCQTHVLSGRMRLPGFHYELSMSCPGKKTVNFLGYQIPGSRGHTIINRNTGKKEVSVSKFIRPLSRNQIAYYCRHELQGSRARNGRMPVERTRITKEVYVYGSCTGWDKKRSKRERVNIRLVCYRTR